MFYSADASLGGPCFCFPAFLSYARRQDDGGLEAATVLSTYLRFGYNTLRTAQHLGMHRNTLSGKIRRIEEGLGCDLDDLTPSQHYLMLTSCMGILAQHPLSIARKQSLRLDP